MDEHIPAAITEELRLRDVDVLTVQEDGSNELEDPDLLDRAIVLGRIMFSEDADMLTEAAKRQRTGVDFGGLIHTKFRIVSIGQCVVELELICKVCEPAELKNSVQYLPLK